MVVKRAEPGERGSNYLVRWINVVKKVGIRNIDPMEYPLGTEAINLPYCRMLDRYF